MCSTQQQANRRKPMKPIDYVACLDEMYQSQGFPPYKWSQYDSSPWCSFDKSLGETRVALVSSAGIFRDDQDPFDPWAVNDLSFRQIPVDIFGGFAGEAQEYR